MHLARLHPVVHFLLQCHHARQRGQDVCLRRAEITTCPAPAADIHNGINGKGCDVALRYLNSVQNVTHEGSQPA